MSKPEKRLTLRVAIGGLGAVGLTAARTLDAGVAGLALVAVSARDRVRARDRVAGFAAPPPVLPLADLADTADVVVECAPAAVFREVAEPAVRAGRTLVAVSVGALLANRYLVERARESGARIVVPSGAVLGLDALVAAAEGHIESVRMVTRKAPAGLAGVAYLEEQGIDLAHIDAPLRVFSGNAVEGARLFPANVNVAAAVGLAGIGPERTAIEIWADPGVDRNTHTVVVESDSARFEVRIENVPDEDNPRTGKIVSQSVVATLRRLVDPLRVGT